MNRTAAMASHCFRACLAIGVPAGYLLAGLYCLLYDFHWLATVIIAMMHLGIFYTSQRERDVDYANIRSYSCFVLAGILVFAAVWIAWRPEIYRKLPLALIGSVAWSIASWQCSAYLSIVRRQDGKQGSVAPHIARSDQLLVATTPVAIAALLGIIHAATDPEALAFAERLADFFQVSMIGVATGLFLALPWSSLSAALKSWKESPSHRSGA